MDVVGHETVSVHLAPGIACRLAQESQVSQTVAIGEETSAAIVSTLHDVRRDARLDRASSPGHERKTPEPNCS
jgi:hypothetical protein